MEDCLGLVRTKTVVEVPIEHTRCWSCRLLEPMIGEEAGTRRIVKSYKCPKNAVLPERLPPFFAEKCRDYTPKEKGKS